MGKKHKQGSPVADAPVQVNTDIEAGPDGGVVAKPKKGKRPYVVGDKLRFHGFDGAFRVGSIEGDQIAILNADGSTFSTLAEKSLRKAAVLANTGAGNGTPKSAPKECECGCGGMTKGGRFQPGHDSKVKHAESLGKKKLEAEAFLMSSSNRLSAMLGSDVDVNGPVGDWLLALGQKNVERAFGKMPLPVVGE